jgi:hypothetical protein
LVNASVAVDEKDRDLTHDVRHSLSRPGAR